MSIFVMGVLVPPEASGGLDKIRYYATMVLVLMTWAC